MYRAYADSLTPIGINLTNLTLVILSAAKHAAHGGRDASLHSA
jgi:hypothetical protein